MFLFHKYLEQFNLKANGTNSEWHQGTIWKH